MSDSDDSMSSVMVLEAGAQWPPWIVDYQRLAPNAVVVAHTPGESMRELADRVERRLHALPSRLGIAVVACAPTVDAQHLAAREHLCRALCGTLSEHDAGEVVLAANADGSEGAKQAVFELAGLLFEGLQGSLRTVRVRFSSNTTRSGIVSRPVPRDSAIPGKIRSAAGGS